MNYHSVSSEESNTFQGLDIFGFFTLLENELLVKQSLPFGFNLQCSQIIDTLYKYLDYFLIIQISCEPAISNSCFG